MKFDKIIQNWKKLKPNDFLQSQSIFFTKKLYKSLLGNKKII